VSGRVAQLTDQAGRLQFLSNERKAAIEMVSRSEREIVGGPQLDASGRNELKQRIADLEEISQVLSARLQLAAEGAQLHKNLASAQEALVRTREKRPPHRGTFAAPLRAC